MNCLTPAFCTTTPLSLTTSRTTLSSRCRRRPLSYVRSRKAQTLRMTEETPAAEEVTVSAAEKEVTVSAAEKEVTVSAAEKEVTVSAVEKEVTVSDDENEVTVSAAEILKEMRAESAEEQLRDDGNRSTRTMLGVYRDVDGKSNVWAVEPKEETDTKPQIPVGAILAGAAVFIVVALLILPLLPFTNADQF